jgi:NAD kinase
MNRLTESKIVVVTRRTRVEELLVRFSSIGQARFYVSHLGQDFSDYESEDEQYSECIRQAVGMLSNLGRVQSIDRSYLSNYLFGPEDVVVVLGQDGLVANTVKYLNGQPVVGVNPDPKRWDGQLLPFRLADLGKVMPEVLMRRRPTKPVTMAVANLNTGESLHAVNDLFIGPKSHTSARYVLESGGRSEAQCSSGVIVSTGVGSTGWLRSLLTGAAALASVSDPVHSSPPPLPGQRGRSPVRPTVAPARNRTPDSSFPWDSPFLRFTVREPFPSQTTEASLVHGTVTAQTPLVITSQMSENGILFSDGIEADFLEFRSGTKATIQPASRKGVLVV